MKEPWNETEIKHHAVLRLPTPRGEPASEERDRWWADAERFLSEEIDRQRKEAFEAGRRSMKNQIEFAILAISSDLPTSTPKEPK